MFKKKFLILIYFIFLYSCSSDDSSNSSEIQITPPNWIQGKWLAENPDGSPLNSGFEFKSNDLIVITTSFQQSQRVYVQNLIDLGQNASATDSGTNTSYSLSVSLPLGQDVIYSFTKISDNEISWDSVIGSAFIRQ
jgi:hypothetical protein